MTFYHLPNEITISLSKFCTATEFLFLEKTSFSLSIIDVNYYIDSSTRKLRCIIQQLDLRSTAMHAGLHFLWWKVITRPGRKFNLPLLQTLKYMYAILNLNYVATVELSLSIIESVTATAKHIRNPFWFSTNIWRCRDFRKLNQPGGCYSSLLKEFMAIVFYDYTNKTHIGVRIDHCSPFSPFIT